MDTDAAFKKENIAVFYKLLILIFNADEYVSDGTIPEAEKETLSNFLRIFSQYREDDIAFQNILSSKAETLDDVIAQLSALTSDVSFYYILQAYALCAVDGINIIEAEILTSIAEAVIKDARAMAIINSVFTVRDYDNPDILYIGNDPHLCDIVKTRDELSAYIIRRNDNYYLLTGVTRGLLRMNNNAAFDHILYRFDINDRFSVNNEGVSFADIMLRFELKNNDAHIAFFIVKKAMKSGTTFSIIPYDVEPSAGEVIGIITVKRSHISVMKNNQTVDITVGSHSVGREVYNGSIDDRILIDNHFLFDLSSDLSSIVFSNSITSKIIKSKEVTIGNDKLCDVFVPLTLPRNRVARLTLKYVKNRKWVLDTIEAHLPVSINNVPVRKRRAVARSGDVIEIARNYIIFDPDNNNVSLLKTKIHSVKANELTFRFRDGTNGITRLLFQNTNKDFCCIMGPSGSGKSTLVKLLTGYRPPEVAASLQFNNYPLYEHFDSFKKHIGYVSQEDLLFENLTVYENMFFYGRIKAPELDPAELDRKIINVLTELGIADKRDQVVGAPDARVLSGGERKRLNIGLELMSDVSVLVLDEPTSGLSSFDTIKIIDLLGAIAMQGKILYVVIHQPSLDVFMKFTHLILLDRGGHLAYFGATRTAFSYFSKYHVKSRSVRTPDDILEVLEAVKLTPDGETIYEYDSRNNKIPMRVKTPKQWSDEYYTRRYREFDTPSTADETASAEENILPEAAVLTVRHRLAQFIHLLARNFINKFRDRASTALSLFIPAVLAVFLSAVLRYQEGTSPYTLADNINIPKYLFLSSIIFIFLAVSNSISEVLKDRLVLDKEKLIGYSSVSYLIAKIAPLTLVCVYQVLIYTVISFLILGVPIFIAYDGITFVSLFLKFSLLSITASLSATALGLFVSCFLTSEKAAFLAVPLMIIPQIIFGGMFLNFNELKMLNLFAKNRPVPVLCNAIHSRWMYEGYLNVFRYDNPDKVVTFQTEAFTERFGKFNNREVMDVFRKYNLSSAKTESVREAEEEASLDRFERFTDAVRALEDGKLSFIDYLKLAYSGNVNHFPYYKKIVYPFVLGAYQYDLAALVAIFTILFAATAVKLERDRQ
ncbi:MAG: ATP-binding cassette domain-containing protein [Spirochaetota bacterium]